MLIAGDGGIRTTAVPARVTPRAARAWIHGRHEHEVRREGHISLCPTHRDKPVLKRLPYRLEHRVGEFGQLVQEEYASMAKRNLPRARLPAAAHQSRMRDG